MRPTKVDVVPQEGRPPLIGPRNVERLFLRRSRYPNAGGDVAWPLDRLTERDARIAELEARPRAGLA